MGEILYAGAVAGSQEGAANSQAMLLDAMRRFCRSVELCDGYLRGCYGLKMVGVPPAPTSKTDLLWRALLIVHPDNTSFAATPATKSYCAVGREAC